MFTFTEEMIKVALKENGWIGYFNDNFDEDWVHVFGENPDWRGVDMMTAFKNLLHAAKLI